MSAATRRVLGTLSRFLPADRRVWVEALAAEADAVPAGPRRLAWLLGSVPVLVSEARLPGYGWLVLPVLFLPMAVAPAVVLPAATAIALACVLAARGRTGRWPWGDPDRSAFTLRTVMVVALMAVAVLTALVTARYPQTASGGGTVIYSTLLVLVLSGYLAGTVALTRTAALAVRYALPAGLLAAALWTLGLPVGNAYHLASPWLVAPYVAGLILAFGAPPLLAGLLVARRTRAVEQGVLAGLTTGMYAAVTNLVGGLALVLLLPQRVPFDSDVLRHYHTAADIRGGNVGEDLVVFIGLLLIWPLVGALLGTISALIPAPQPGSGPPYPEP